MAFVKRELGASASRGEQFLSSDVVYDVLGRVDAMTLARASCVSSQFRAVCHDENFWEKICNSRWPSTRESSVKKLVASLGGFKKLYSDCFPYLKGGASAPDLIRTEPLRQELCPDNIYDEGWWQVLDSSSDFTSLVDVVFNGESVLSRVVEGIPRATASFGLLVDILGGSASASEIVHDVTRKLAQEEGSGAFTIRTCSLPRLVSMAQERKDGKLWTALCRDMRVSWILIHKKTRRMVNLASWKPLGGLRHRPCGPDFPLRFGSILATNSSSSIHCNVSMKCEISTAEDDDLDSCSAPTTFVRITDFGMQLEDVHGVHLRGQEAVSMLFWALDCEKTVNESDVLKTYQVFSTCQNAHREYLLCREGYRQTATALFVCGITVFICFYFILI